MEEILIEGKLIKIMFAKNENNYYIGKIKEKNTLEEIVVCGYFPLFSEDQNYSFKGNFGTHKIYGKQFYATYCQEIKDTSRQGIINYLSSDRFKAIGPQTARKIYQSFGENCVEKILQNPDILKELNFNQNRIKGFVEELRKSELSDKVLITLLDYGISEKIANKLIAKYSYDAVNVLKSNPYQLIEDIYGVAFIKADEIALKTGIKPDSEIRIKEAILYVMTNLCNNYGDTFLIHEDIIGVVRKYLSKHSEIDVKLIENSLEKLLIDEEIVKEEEKYFLKAFLKAEMIVSERLKELLKNENPFYEENEIIEVMSEVEKKLNITYTKSQKEAIFTALLNNVSIITGGPGTGKTTVLHGFLECYARLKKVNINVEKSNSIVLMAPTGKAAKRLAEKTDFNATTIHYQLGYNSDSDGDFKHHESNPLMADLIIIDEVSMVDIILARHLFCALKKNCQLLLVGDIDQLPSVGPGDLLNDLISSRLIPVIALEEIHRQAQDSKIIELSHNIRKGNSGNNFLTTGKDITYFNTANSEETNLVIIDCLKKLEALGNNLYFDVQVLAPMRMGDSGVDNLNILIQKEINGDTEKTKMAFSENYFFRLHDKVIQTKNEPNKGIMNGDVGKIIDIQRNQDKKETLKIQFGGEDEQKQIVELARDEVNNLKLAYALTIHKSQGSEYKYIILPVVSGFQSMLRKKLIYTAVTRAKLHLIIIGELELMKTGINRFEDKRQTTLKERLLAKNSDKNEDLAKSAVTPYDFL